MPDEASGTPAEDLMLLLNAVTERLVLALLESQEPTRGGGLPDADLHLQSIVRDCVWALQEVQAALNDECDQRQRMALDMQEVRSALARAQAQLATAKAGTVKARRMALHDGLTALPNRRYLLARLHAVLASAVPEGRPPALLYIDLDGFKAVNDAHGHGVGDQLLRIVASRLRRAVRAADVVSRLGGDEFACLVFGASDHAQLCRLAGKLHDTVASPLMVGQLELSVRPSIGIATAPAGGITAEALLGHADTAMYLAKRQRSGFEFFDPKDQPAPSLAWPLRPGAEPN